MRIVAVILVGLLGMSSVYAVDNRLSDDLELKNSKYIIFAESEEPLKELNTKLGYEFMTELKNVQRFDIISYLTADTDVRY